MADITLTQEQLAALIAAAVADGIAAAKSRTAAERVPFTKSHPCTMAEPCDKLFRTLPRAASHWHPAAA